MCDNAAMKRCPAQLQKKKKITHFVKFVTTVFPLRIAEGMLLVKPDGPHQSRTWAHRGIEQTVTGRIHVRQFFAAPSKTVNSKALSERHSCRCHAL